VEGSKKGVTKKKLGGETKRGGRTQKRERTGEQTNLGEFRGFFVVFEMGTEIIVLLHDSGLGLQFAFFRAQLAGLDVVFVFFANIVATGLRAVVFPVTFTQPSENKQQTERTEQQKQKEIEKMRITRITQKGGMRKRHIPAELVRAVGAVHVVAGLVLRNQHLTLGALLGNGSQQI
jgi:hypothetical protein